MSLHIESTEDALAELKRQRVKNLAAAVSVSVLGAAMMSLLLYLANIITFIPEPPATIVYPAVVEKGTEEPERPELVQKTQRPSSPAMEQQVRAIATDAALDTAIRIPDTEMDEPSESLLSGTDIGTDFGPDDNEGPGSNGPDIIILSKRCDPNDRMKRITENGGIPQCEEAVVKSLK